ncbi:hypothetical protein SCLCIDRAFT_334274 [Scleroderma citrinum Foug A]|uniref:Uncharacterized protein n=1 Tax=Scleroderma citrinum Foug A TaxID=1036808 RepID=A0A0C3D280_9AGAM|nr:hypothetical protein SCLCIDRAFT_334274 [Scleroderma citrinum Foug A]
MNLQLVSCHRQGTSMNSTLFPIRLDRIHPFYVSWDEIHADECNGLCAHSTYDRLQHILIKIRTPRPPVRVFPHSQHGNTGNRRELRSQAAPPVLPNFKRG